MTFNLSQPLGNNAFSYDLRRQLGSDTTLVISDACEIPSLDQVQLGDFVVFEEAQLLNPRGEGTSVPLDGRGTACGGGFRGDLQSHTGLAHTYILKVEKSITGLPRRTSSQGRCTVVITDNHNHVLPYRLNHISEHQGQPDGSSLPYSLIHIDQHSDLGPNSNTLDTSQIHNHQYARDFAHLHCNIGNFITPCIESGLITEMTQIRTEYTLNEISNLSPLTSTLGPVIIDIDLDFRAPEMGFHHKPGGTPSTGISNIERSISQVRSIMDHADLITIATSPYFIDQTLALDLLHQLLGPRFQSQEEMIISKQS